MLSIPDRRIGDAWLFRDGQTWHAYLLTCPLATPAHEWWDVTHATSSDLRSWTMHGEVVRSVREPASLAGCVATGSVVRNPLAGRRYLMAHTLRHAGPNPGVILRDSDDLHDWHLVGEGPACSLADDQAGRYQPIGTGRRAIPHFRDPFLFEWKDELHFIVCASRDTDGCGGTVAAARYDDGTWHLLPPPKMPAVCEELECPQVHQVGPGDWRLIFSSNRDWLDPSAATETGVYSFAGPTPLGPWGDLRPLHVGGAYAAQVVREGDRWLLIGTNFSGLGSLSDPVDVTDAMNR